MPSTNIRNLIAQGRAAALREEITDSVKRSVSPAMVDVVETAVQLGSVLAAGASLPGIGTAIAAMAQSWVSLWRHLDADWKRDSWDRRNTSCDARLFEGGKQPGLVYLERVGECPTPPSADTWDGLGGWSWEDWQREYNNTVYTPGPAAGIYQNWPSQSPHHTSRRPWGLEFVLSSLPGIGASQVPVHPEDVRQAVMRSTRAYLGEYHYSEELFTFMGGSEIKHGVTYSDQWIYLYPFMPAHIDGHTLSHEDHTPAGLAWQMSLFEWESNTRAHLSDDEIAVFLDHYSDWCDLLVEYYVLDTDLMPIKRVGKKSDKYSFPPPPHAEGQKVVSLPQPSLEGLRAFFTWSTAMLILLDRDKRIEISGDIDDPLGLIRPRIPG